MNAESGARKTSCDQSKSLVDTSLELLFPNCMTITSQAPTGVGPAELRKLRRAAGLTQRELALHAECSLSWIANAEGGYVPRASVTLGRVLDVLSDTTTYGPGPADEGP